MARPDRAVFRLPVSGPVRQFERPGWAGFRLAVQCLGDRLTALKILPVLIPTIGKVTRSMLKNSRWQMKRYWILSSMLIALSCKSESVAPSLMLEATFIVKQNIGCRLPVIEFTKGIEQARKIAGTRDTYEGHFSVYKLDTIYWQPGRKLKLTIRPASEATICDAMGAWYPAVEIDSIQK